MHAGERPLEVGAVEFDRQRVQDGLRELVEVTLVDQDGPHVRATPLGRGRDGNGDRHPPGFETSTGRRGR